MQWLADHKAMLMVFAVSVLDFVMALSPGLKSNGILHFIYLALGGKES